MKTYILNAVTILTVATLLSSCDKNDDMHQSTSGTITIENVLDSKPLVESGTFKGTGTPPVILPGQSVAFSFFAA